MTPHPRFDAGPVRQVVDDPVRERHRAHEHTADTGRHRAAVTLGRTRTRRGPLDGATWTNAHTTSVGTHGDVRDHRIPGVPDDHLDYGGASGLLHLEQMWSRL